MYKFPLEPVLNHRKFIEENHQKELALSERLLSDEKARLFAIKNARKKLLGELQQKQEKGITVSEALLYFGFIDHLSKDLENQEKRTSEVKTKCDQKRADLIDAMKKLKALKKLKDKRSKTYRQELMKIEQDFTNEVAIDKFNRKNVP